MVGVLLVIGALLHALCRTYMYHAPLLVSEDLPTCKELLGNIVAEAEEVLMRGSGFVVGARSKL